MKRDAAALGATWEWIEKADSDVRAAEVLLADDSPLVGIAVFHLQQAVEKLMKGLLTLWDIPFRKTHDLADLGRRLCEREPDLEEMVRRAEPLTVFAWAYRYPGEAGEPSHEEAVNYLEIVRETRQSFVARLPEEPRRDA